MRNINVLSLGIIIGTDKSSQAIQVTSITASPVPLLAPGPLHLTFSAKVLKPVPVFQLSFEMKRHGFLGTRIHIPCVGGIGSWFVSTIF